MKHICGYGDGFTDKVPVEQTPELAAMWDEGC